MAICRSGVIAQGNSHEFRYVPVPCLGRGPGLGVVFKLPLFGPIRQFLKDFRVGDGGRDCVLPAEPAIEIDLPTTDTAKRQQSRIDAHAGSLTDGTGCRFSHRTTP